MTTIRGKGALRTQARPKPAALRRLLARHRAKVRDGSDDPGRRGRLLEQEEDQADVAAAERRLNAPSGPPIPFAEARRRLGLAGVSG